MMNQNDLEKYFNGELDSEAESLRVQLYIAEHPDDPRLLSLCDSVFESQCGQPAGNDAEQDLDAIHSILGSSHRKKEIRKLRLWRGIASVAAAAVIPLAVTVGLLLRESRPVEYHRMTVPECGVRTLTLSDGTSLTLGSGSSVVYPERFKGKERRIFLNGQVFAQVSKDPRHPFVIRSGDVDVTVHGTTFNFKSWEDADQVELCLLEGAVTLAMTEEARDVRLQPGEMVRYSRRAGSFELSAFDTDEYSAANVNSLRFSNESLSEIALELEKVFGVRIVVADEKLAGRRFFSYFTNGESLDEILEALSAGTMSISRPGDGLVILTAI